MASARWFRIATALLAVGLLSSACGRETPADGNADELKVERIVVDGRPITCVVYDDARHAQGGVSCDWRNE